MAAVVLTRMVSVCYRWDRAGHRGVPGNSSDQEVFLAWAAGVDDRSYGYPYHACRISGPDRTRIHYHGSNNGVVAKGADCLDSCDQLPANKLK